MVKISIVMDYANNGDLETLINKNKQKETELEEEEIWNIFMGLVRGLKILHQMNIFHRDIKVPIIFIQAANVFMH